MKLEKFEVYKFTGIAYEKNPKTTNSWQNSEKSFVINLLARDLEHALRLVRIYIKSITVRVLDTYDKDCVLASFAEVKTIEKLCDVTNVQDKASN